MRRPARRLLTLCSAASLLLCAAVCVLWVRSYWAWDGVGWASALYEIKEVKSQDFASVRTLRGGLFITRFRFYAMPEGFASPEGLKFESVSVAEADELDAAHYGFSPWKVNVPKWELGNRRVIVPLWMPALATLLLPVGRLWQHRRHQRRIENRLCARCGYDLRATPGRCPECGTAAAANSEPPPPPG